MALRTTINVWDEDGYEADRITSSHVSASYTATLYQRMTLPASASKVEIDLGPLTTIEYLFIESDKAIEVYKNNGIASWSANGLFLITGCSITALHVKATDGAALLIYAAGS